MSLQRLDETLDAFLGDLETAPEKSDSDRQAWIDARTAVGHALLDGNFGHAADILANLSSIESALVVLTLERQGPRATRANLRLGTTLARRAIGPPRSAPATRS